MMPAQHQHMIQSSGLNVHPQQHGAMMPFGGMAMGMGGMGNPFGMQSMFQTMVSCYIIITIHNHMIVTIIMSSPKMVVS